MYELKITGNKLSRILIGEDFNNIEKYLTGKNVVIITDKNVDDIYGARFPDFPKIVLGTGEQIKTLQTVELIVKKLINIGIDRHGFLLGIGGGIVCDITGFAASVFMRGVDFGFVSTTLLSQVDASVGGKNGVNFDSYKNIIGNFNQPDFVICDMKMLKSLPEKEVRCGMGEIVKHALIADRTMFDFIKKNTKEALSLDTEVVERLITRSVEIKSDVVNKDEKEKGERKKLNFGHTLAHAIEKYSDISHGEAVSIGIMFAVWLSAKKGLINDSDIDKVKSVLLDLNLPVTTNVLPDKLAEAVHKDKKKNSKTIDIVLLNEIGEAFVTPFDLSEVGFYIHEFLK
jgi:3-dehydroquinate synthase